jgi:hypothetical protein
MILDALVNQLNQRFQHEKRAQVCLWFDERQEFARLLDALDGHLGSMIHAPFRLLRYRAGEGHGQIWIKHQIHQVLHGAKPEVRKSLRFVLYLPMGEEHLAHPGLNGEPDGFPFATRLPPLSRSGRAIFSRSSAGCGIARDAALGTGG